MKRITLVGSLIFALSACSGAAPPTASSSQAIINGTLDDGDPAVVLLFAQVPGQSGGSLCTAEIISPHVVMTAAHCVAPQTVGAGAVFTVFTGTALPAMGAPPADTLLKVSETHFNPAFMLDAMGNDSNDIAVVILEQPTAIPPLTFNHFDLPAKLAGSAVRLVGYGLTDGSDTAGTTAGTRHTAPTTLNFIRPQIVELWDNMHSNCEGDSGGPALMMLNGKERIAGITQVGYVGCPVKLAASDTRVDAYASFVDGYVNMIDPPAVAPGGACTADSECGTLACLNGICTPSCDPMAATNTCPAGLSCTSVDDQPMCTKGGKGCAYAGGTPDRSALALLLVAFGLLALRRRRA